MYSTSVPDQHWICEANSDILPTHKLNIGWFFLNKHEGKKNCLGALFLQNLKNIYLAFLITNVNVMDTSREQQSIWDTSSWNQDFCPKFWSICTYCDISHDVWKFNLLVVVDEKSCDRHSQWDSSSQGCECLKYLCCHDILYNLDQSDGPSNWSLPLPSLEPFCFHG